MKSLLLPLFSALLVLQVLGREADLRLEVAKEASGPEGTQSVKVLIGESIVVKTADGVVDFKLVAARGDLDPYVETSSFDWTFTHGENSKSGRLELSIDSSGPIRTGDRFDVNGVALRWSALGERGVYLYLKPGTKYSLKVGAKSGE